jgi:hypothetical protein
MPSVGCMRWIYGWEEVLRNKHRPKPRDDLLEIWQVCWPQRGPLFLTDYAPQSSTAVGFFFRTVSLFRMMWVMGGVFSWRHAEEVALTFDSRGTRESQGRGTDSSRKLQGAWVHGFGLPGRFQHNLTSGVVRMCWCESKEEVEKL